MFLLEKMGDCDICTPITRSAVSCRPAESQIVSHLAPCFTLCPWICWRVHPRAKLATSGSASKPTGLPRYRDIYRTDQTHRVSTSNINTSPNHSLVCLRRLTRDAAESLGTASRSRETDRRHFGLVIFRNQKGTWSVWISPSQRYINRLVLGVTHG